MDFGARCIVLGYHAVCVGFSERDVTDLVRDLFDYSVLGVCDLVCGAWCVGSDAWFVGFGAWFV